ncbi:phosphoserine phosphatase SerB [Antribacter gilvus]|uniref:phosphoserine phosphatase SerB n=1 Tax=Antribacter gilvus TaxID=2304675 RepID=UPI001F0C4447|nr:phosphoserine phosphatase SerB [Antribacter gilvus]
MSRLIVTDVDSTFIRQEVVELLADHAGTRDLVQEVTERAMRGEIDFADSLAERVATLKDVPVSALAHVLAAVELTPGARELVAAVRARGWTFGLVSGGFGEIVAPLADSLGIGLWRANRLEVIDGRLTGRTEGPIVDRAVKETTLREWAAKLGIPMSRTVAVGDGANDLDMIRAAGVGVAFNAKPVVREQAPYSLEDRLDGVLELLDRLDG